MINFMVLDWANLMIRPVIQTHQPIKDFAELPVGHLHRRGGGQELTRVVPNGFRGLFAWTL